MGGAVGADPAGFAQRPRVSLVGLDLLVAGRVHRGEVRVGDDDLVPELFEVLRDSLALG